MCFSISRNMFLSGLQFKVAGLVRSACYECHVDTHGGLGDHWVQALDNILSFNS